MTHAPADTQELLGEARAFMNDEWETILADLEALVAIDSSRDLATACAGAPFGAGPRAALDKAAELVETYGFELHDLDGQCGYFDVEGRSPKQLAIIGHLDVVPADDAWTKKPFALTRETSPDGNILFGRGVTDDKGPMLMALHAVRFWRNRLQREGREFPMNLRVIFGCSEETGMTDVDYYLERHAAPDFLFTPDAFFPLGYGEKGILQVRVTSKPLAGGVLVAFAGGTAPNGVPNLAKAVVRCPATSLPATEGIEVDEDWDPGLVGGDICSNYGGLARVRAHGVARHASRPEGAVNAIDVLAQYLLDNKLCDTDEREWLEFVRRITASTDGMGLGIACEDEDFGPATCVGGMAETKDDCFTQTIDIRFPTTTNLPELNAKITAAAEQIGATVECISGIEPFLTSPDSPEVRALCDAYAHVTGQEAKPFTMGGGSYARHFPVGVSFGAMDEERFPTPPGVGGMHAADEGVREDCLREALVIYILAIGNLLELDWR